MANNKRSADSIMSQKITVGAAKVVANYARRYHFTLALPATMAYYNQRNRTIKMGNQRTGDKLVDGIYQTIEVAACYGYGMEALTVRVQKMLDTKPERLIMPLADDQSYVNFHAYRFHNQLTIHERPAINKTGLVRIPRVTISPPLVDIFNDALPEDQRGMTGVIIYVNPDTAERSLWVTYYEPPYLNPTDCNGRFYRYERRGEGT